MPAAWPPMAPLVDELLGTPYEQMDCWGLLAALLQRGFGLDLARDAECLNREFVEVWFAGDARPLETLLQPWDVLICSMYGLVGDHCGVAMNGTQFVHARGKAGVAIERLHRWEEKVLQIARLRRLV